MDKKEYEQLQKETSSWSRNSDGSFTNYGKDCYERVKKAIKEFLPDNFYVPSETNVLVVGCGEGVELEEFKKEGYQVTGLDINPEKVAKAKSNGLRALKGTIESMFIRSDIYPRQEIVYASHVLEHALNLKESIDILKEYVGRTFYIVVPIQHIPNKSHTSPITKEEDITKFFEPQYWNVRTWRESHCDDEIHVLATRKKIGVYTVTWDRLNVTKEWFEIMYRMIKYPIYQHIIVDNGSKDGTAEWLKEIEKDRSFGSNIKVILNDKNKGTGFAMNQAFEILDADYHIKIDNDCEFQTENLFKQMLDIAYEQEKNNQDYMMSPYVNGLVVNKGGVPRSRYSTIAGHKIGITSALGGIFRWMPKSTQIKYLGKIIPWLNETRLHSTEDMDISAIMRKNNIPIFYIEDIFVNHMDNEFKRPDAEYFKRREITFKNKYDKETGEYKPL